MAVPLLQTSTVRVDGAICFSYMNPRSQVWESRSSSSQAFPCRTRPGHFGCMKAYGPNSSSVASSAKISVRAHLEASEGLLKSNDTKFQQQHQLHDFIIPKFIPPFSHKRNPLEEEANRAAQQWYHHYFSSTISPETFYKIKNGSCQTIPTCVHPTAELSRLEWALEFYLFLFVIDDVVECKTRTSSLEDLEELFLELMVLMISSFPEDQIFKENLTKYFDDEIDHKLIKDFAEKVNARAMQYSKTGMLHLNLIC
jgi:hypothetical protein